MQRGPAPRAGAAAAAMPTLATPARPGGTAGGEGPSLKLGRLSPSCFSPGMGGPAWCKRRGRRAGVTVAAGKGVSADLVLPPLPRKTQIPSGWDKTPPAPPKSTAQEGTGQLSVGGFEGIYPKKKPTAGKQEHGKQLPIILPAMSDGWSVHSQHGRSGRCFATVLFVTSSPCFQMGYPLSRGKSMRIRLLCNPPFRVKAIPEDGAV